MIIAQLFPVKPPAPDLPAIDPHLRLPAEILNFLGKFPLLEAAWWEGVYRGFFVGFALAATLAIMLSFVLSWPRRP